MPKDERLLETALDDLIQRVQALKQSLQAFLGKLEFEHQTIQWPSILDSFALLSSQMNSLNRLLLSDKCPALRNVVVLPILLSPQPDPDLEKLTDGRVQVCTHDLVPDYLRTKLEPEVEEKVSSIMNKASTLSSDTMQKQITMMNKAVNNLIDMINKAKDEGERTVSQKTQQQPMSVTADTTLLVKALTVGKGVIESPNRRMEQGSEQHRQGFYNSPLNFSGSTTKAPSSMKNSGRAQPYSRT